MRRACLFLAALLPVPALAQQTDEQLWLAANATTAIAEDATLTVETIGRFGDRAGGFMHAELGVLGSVKIADNVEVAAGYRHVEDWDQGRALPGEERARQMVTVTLGSGFATRLRFEQRFHSTGGAIGLRVRPQLRFNQPLSDGGLALFATHESFVNVNTTGWGQAGGYERMRNAAGLSIPLAEGLRSDIGYLNQYRFGRGGARDRMDHALTFSLSLTLGGGSTRSVPAEE